MQHVTKRNEITGSKTITGHSLWVGVRVISWSWHWCSYFWWGSCGMTGRVSVCRTCWTWDPDLETRVWNCIHPTQHIARITRGRGTGAPRCNRGVTASSVTMSIVMSSMTSNMKYITPMISNVKFVFIFNGRWPIRSENQHRAWDKWICDTFTTV